MDELKPCPFCGEVAEYDSRHWGGNRGHSGAPLSGHAIYCSDINCIGNSGFSHTYDTKEEAVNAWNNRAPSPLVTVLSEAGKAVLEWYDRDGATGTIGEPMENLRDALAQAAEPDDCTDPHVEAVIQKLRERAREGLRKYGVDLTRDDLSEAEWLQHLQEELLDGANYCQRRLSSLAQAAERDGA